jgi:hypothetical protein
VQKWEIGINSDVLGSLRLVFRTLFDAHVLQFAGLEDFATFQTLYKLGVFVAAYNLHARVLARFTLGIRRLGKRL